MGNQHARHDDKRTQEREQKYGDLADLSVSELQDRARQKGIDNPSQMNKDQLLEAITR